MFRFCNYLYFAFHLANYITVIFMKSVWQDSAKLPEFPALKKDIKTDVLIIGGGLCGLLCAYMLNKKGVDCALVEQGRICSGVTAHTTAKITSQHGLVYSKLVRQFGVGGAKLYYKANEAAIDMYRHMCKKIDCDFEQKDSYVYSLSDRRKLEKELDALYKIGATAEYAEELPLPLKTVGAVKFSRQAQFNPFKFAAAAVKGLPVYENTRVIRLEPHSAVCDGAKIRAKIIIVATHFPLDNSHGSYFLKMYQHRSYVIALENAQQVNGMYVDESMTGLSFRNYGNLLLLGGGGHRTGKIGGNYTELENFAARYYPGSSEKYRFATQDCMTLDSVPYIGRYSANTPNLYVATGFNKWGMTSSMLSAMILCDAVCGSYNPYARLFSPSRTVLRPQLAVNAAEAVMHLVKPTAPRCSHMGCALKWNSAEHSWDCPCHGSRYDENGRVLNNPARKDIIITE